MRWKIEVFHKILKLGCRIEEEKLRTAGQLANLVALFCIVSWRVLWMTMIARAAPAVALTSSEITILDRLVSDAGNRRAKSGTLLLYLIKLARLGGYLAGMSDLPPGNTVVWRGLRRLADSQLGTEIKNAPTYG